MGFPLKQAVSGILQWNDVFIYTIQDRLGNAKLAKGKGKKKEEQELEENIEHGLINRVQLKSV